jgi:hypothetical protein
MLLAIITIISFAFHSLAVVHILTDVVTTHSTLHLQRNSAALYYCCVVLLLRPHLERYTRLALFGSRIADN